MAVASPEQLAAGRSFGHYQVVRHLGTGGMGSVYEATHVELGKRVALKTLLPVYAADADARERFLREGKLAAKLHHPHVVDVTDCGIHEGTPYLVMEFLEGEDLASLLDREGKLFPEQIADVMVPIVAAVAVAHDEDIIHRDLKPENIFLTKSGHGETIAKVLDFGISKALSESDLRQLTGSLSLVGTPAYMAPEQVRSSKQLDDRCDQYAMGVILYQCTTGRLPFSAEAVFELLRLVADGKYTRPSALVPGLPPAFEAVITTAMAMSPADRYENTREFGAALLPFASARTQMMWSRDFESKADTVITNPRGRPLPVSAPHSVPTPEPITDPGLLPGGTPAPAPPTPKNGVVALSESSARIENPHRPEESVTDSPGRSAPRDVLRSSDETLLVPALTPRSKDSEAFLAPLAPPSRLPLAIGGGVAVLLLAALGIKLSAPTPVTPAAAVGDAPPAAAPAPTGLAAPAAPNPGGVGRVRVLIHGHPAPTAQDILVEIDGLGTKGRAPLELTVPLGQHLARVTYEGRVQEMSIDVKKGETILFAP